MISFVPYENLPSEPTSELNEAYTIWLPYTWKAR
jgi:hypothetical protein